MQKKRIILIFLLTIALILLCVIVIRQKIKKQDEAENTASITVMANEAVELAANKKNASSLDSDDEVLVSPADYRDNVINDDTVLRYELDVGKTDTELYMLEFGVDTAGETIAVEIQYGDIVNTVYFLPSESVYCIPITAAVDFHELVIREKSETIIPFTIDYLYLINYGEDANINEYAIGYYNIGDVSRTVLTEEDVLTKDISAQCLIKDDIVFSLGNGKLTSYREGDEKLCVVEGLGMTRDMEFARDKQAILVSSRQNGMYIVDISDPENMTVISHYDTLEASTGIFVDGDYCFLGNRYFGIEIVDVSDKNNPQYVNSIKLNSEYQDCFVLDGYLYVGVYAQKRVDIYDIHDLMYPKLKAQIDVDGCAQGLYVRGDMLYVATGLNSNNSEAWRNGTGNGLEIYDVSDKDKPVLQSVIKTDGAYNFNANSTDVWDVKVAENYAYLSSMGNGLYVIDVSDVKHPVIVKNIRITVDTESEKFNKYDDKYVVPWNWDYEGGAGISHVTFDDEYIYLVSPALGLLRVANESGDKEKELQTSDCQVSDKSPVEYSLDNYDVQTYKTNSSIWAAVEYNGYIYAAAGENGIIVLDEDLNEVLVKDVQCSVKDIVIKDNILYAAESEAGIGIYSIENNLEEIGHSERDDGINAFSVSMIKVSSDGKNLLAQASTNTIKLYEIASDYQLVEKISTGSAGFMYYRNLSKNETADSCMIAFGKNNLLLFEGTGKELIENAKYNEGGGVAAKGDYIIEITGKGYSYYDCNSKTWSKIIRVDDVELYGKCICYNNLLCVVDERNGNVAIIDIEDIDRPKPVEYFSVDGNPDVPYCSDGMILIPCRNGGLIKLFSKYDS